MEFYNMLNRILPLITDDNKLYKAYFFSWIDRPEGDVFEKKYKYV